MLPSQMGHGQLVREVYAQALAFSVDQCVCWNQVGHSLAELQLLALEGRAPARGHAQMAQLVVLRGVSSLCAFLV